MGERWAIDWQGLERGDHVVQIYDDDAHMVENLCAFASDGLGAGESVVLIATAAHRDAVRARLLEDGFDVDQAAREDRYIALPAADTLELFMHRGFPDE